MSTPALEDVVLADWNAEVPESSEFAVRAWIDKNAASGVAIDLNQTRPDGPPEKPAPPEAPEAPDLTSDWLGDRRDGSGTNLPHSVYQDPDLTFVDPPDYEEPYGDWNELHEQLAAQANG